MSESSERSELSQQSIDVSKIPSIHLEEFIMDSHAKILSGHYSKDDDKPRIFTVAQTLKDPFILSHIKPDYGSLGEFMTDINLSKDLLAQKKRKNQSNDEEQEEKKLRYQLRDKDQKQLNQAYLSKSSAALEKKVISKLMVENIFKDSFQMTLNSFQSQNLRPEHSPNSKINLNNIDAIFEGKKQSFSMKQPKIVKKKFDEQELSSHEKGKKKNSQRSFSKWNQTSRYQSIEEIKSAYSTFRKLAIKNQCAQFKALTSKSEEEKLLTEKSERSQKDTDSKFTFEVTGTEISIEKVTIKPELILYLSSQCEIEQIKAINFHQVRISDDCLLFFLDILRTFGHSLEKLTLSCISIQKMPLLACKIKELLEVSSLEALNLNYMDMESKQFCVICLGVGISSSLLILNADCNGIDRGVSKSLDLILKHCPNLREISLRKNYISELDISFISAELREKIKL